MTFPIIQFGTSRFLQAHVDLFVSEALGKGAASMSTSSSARRWRGSPLSMTTMTPKSAGVSAA